MADLATLKVGVDSREVKTATGDLNEMGSAAQRAEADVRGVASASKTTSTAVSGMNTVIKQGEQAQMAAANAMRAVGQTGQLAGHQITNLAFQFQDLGVQIASGQNPLVAFVQQGSQISGVMMQSGMSAKQFGMALLSMLGIVKTTTDAQLMAAAATTAATTARFAALDTQAAGAVMAAQAEIALATSQIQGATSAAALTAATDRLAAAEVRLSAAQVEATATSRTLAIAQAQSAAAATAAGAATTVALAPIAFILAGLAAAAIAVYAAFKMFQSSVEKTGVIKDYANSLGLTKKEMRELEDVHVTFGDVLSGVWTTISEGLGLDKVWQSISEFAVQAFDVILKGAGMATAGIYATFAGSFDAIKVVWKNLPAVLGDLFVQATNSAIGTIEILINAAVNSINFITTKANGVLKSMGLAAVFAQVESVKLGRVANENAGAAARTTAAVFDAYASRYNEALSGMKAIGLQIKQNTLDATKSRLAAQAAALIEKRNEGKPKKAGLSDEQKQFERDLKSAEDYLVSLEKQAAAIGKTTIQLKEMEIAEKAAAAAKVGLKDETLALGAALIEGMKSEKRKEANKELDKTLKALADEYALLGLTGRAREIAALRMQEEAFKADLLAKGLNNVSAAWLAYYTAEMRLINGQSALDLKQKEAEKLKETISGLIDLTDELLGGAGSFLTNLGGQINIAAPDLKTDLKAIFDDLPQNMQDTFSGFLKSLPTVLANARIGQMVGGGAGGAVGGAIGGALGKEFLTKGLQDIGGKVFGKALGSLAGPLGAIAGGVLGGLVGGLLTKTKTGSVTLTQIGGGAMERTLTGNSAKLKGIADNMANGLLKGLGSMAEQLGGTLGGNVKVSLGQRNKDFVVDPTGAGRTKGAGVKNFGQDQAAAVAYVTQLAIQQGIVTGISAGAQTLIRAGNDLNEQVQKALKFDQVFKDLVKESDPLRSSLDELSVEMEKLKGIFKEAGASAADYAKLEELYAIKQSKAIFDANRPRRELEIQLMEAQGRSVEALAASRQLELEAMDASLRSLQTMIYAEQDLAAAREAEQSAISDLQAAVNMLNSNVAEAEANLAEALRAQRERQIESYRAQIADLDVIIAKRQEAQDALRRAYDAEIARIDDEISKRKSNIQSLQDAYSSQANIMQGTIDQFRDFASSLREFASTIIPMNGTGAQSLEGLRRRFADVTKAALGGDKTAMGEVVGVGGQLRESIMANAADRTSMLRQLYALQAQTNTVVSGAEDQATIAEKQLAEAKLQNDHLISIENKAIAQLEAQKAATTALVGQFIQFTEATLSVDEAIRQLQTAEQAATSAEQQKVYLQAQIDALAAVGANVMSVEQAQRELDEAKAERDAVLSEINQRGFSELISVTKQTGAEMARIAMSAIESARASAAQAQAAMAAAAAAAAAAAVKPPVVPVVTPPVVSVLPDNVIPFPIMGGGSGAAGGFNDIGIPQNLYGGGSGGGSFREFGFRNNIHQFANGGIHSGGLRIVGENGPEIEATGPSRIYNSNQLGNMLNHGATADEVKALRDEMKVAMYQIAKNTGKSYDIINRWNGDGLPPERNVG